MEARDDFLWVYQCSKPMKDVERTLKKHVNPAWVNNANKTIENALYCLIKVIHLALIIINLPDAD